MDLGLWLYCDSITIDQLHNYFESLESASRASVIMILYSPLSRRDQKYQHNSLPTDVPRNLVDTNLAELTISEIFCLLLLYSIIYYILIVCYHV